MIYTTLITLAVLFILRPSAASEQLKEQNSVVPVQRRNKNVNGPLCDRKIGIRNQATHSHLNSLITALFTIPDVQKKFFEEAESELNKPGTNVSELLKNSFAFSTAYNFAKLKLFTETFELNREYEEVYRKVYPNRANISENNFDFIDYYWICVVNSLPEAISSLFRFTASLSKSFIDYSDKVFTKESLNYYVSIVLESPVTELTDYMIDNGCIAPSKRFEQSLVNGKFHNLKNNYEIASKPEILTIHVKRFNISQSGNVTLNGKELLISEALSLPKFDENYVLASRIVFDPETMTYSTYARDFRNLKWYKYNFDGTVTLSEFTTVDFNSILLFYVPESVLVKEYEVVEVPAVLSNNLGIEVSERNKRKIGQIYRVETDVKLTPTPEEALKQVYIVPEVEVEMTPEEAERWKSIYKPDVKIYSEQHRSSYHIVVKEITRKMKYWPDELVNCFAKVVFRIYPLGCEEYSFKRGYLGLHYSSIEFVLSALASDEKNVKKMFDLFGTPNATELDSEVAVVLARMLLGCKNISLEKIAKIIKHRTSIDFFSQLSLFDQIRSIISLFDDRIIGIPELKLITYSNLNNDDPSKVITAFTPFPITTPDLIPLRMMTLRNGVYVDFKAADSKRIRHIYKSESEMFIIEVSRDYLNGNGCNLELGGDDYVISGAICLDPFSSLYHAFYQTDFKRDCFLRTAPGFESEFLRAVQDTVEVFKDAVKTRSVVLFLKKKPAAGQSRTVKKVLFIPRELLSKMIKAYSQEISCEAHKE